MLRNLPNRQGRTHMQTRNGLISSYAIKGAEHIGHCLAVLNVNIDAALESDPQVLYAPLLRTTEGISVQVQQPVADKEGRCNKQVVVAFPAHIALENLGSASLFTLLGQIKHVATENQCSQVTFRFQLPKETAEAKCEDNPNQLLFSAEVEKLMERESSGNREDAIEGVCLGMGFLPQRLRLGHYLLSYFLWGPFFLP